MTRLRAYVWIAGLALLAGVALAGAGEIGPIRPAQHGTTQQVVCE